MSSSRRAASDSDDERQSEDHSDKVDVSAAAATDADTRTCGASGSGSQPRHLRASTDVAGRSRSPHKSSRLSADDAELCGTLRCDRHVDRQAELYCQSCHVPICVACVSTRHRALSGHDCCDVEEAVADSRARLAQHAAELDERHGRCLTLIDDTNAKIKSIRSESDEQESRARRHFEEVRMRLEHDLQRVLQELEMKRNGKIKELRRLSSELQETAVKLDGRRNQFDELSVGGTDIEVIEASNTLVLLLDCLPAATEVPEYVQPQFTKSALLQEAKNLVGELQSSKNETRQELQEPVPEEAKPNRRSPISWKCDNCTYINEEKDIECQMCACAPWKNKLLGIQLPLHQLGGKTFADQKDTRPERTSSWRCGICTAINGSASATKCEVCESLRPPDRIQPPAYEVSQLSIQHQQPPHVTITDHSAPSAVDRYRSGSPRNTVDSGSAAFMVSEATQTETGNCAQKMVDRICRLVKNRNSPGNSRDNSRETSPSGRSAQPEMRWKADDANTPWWVCSQCWFQNSIDKMECEQCGYEETDPTVTLYRH